MKLKFKNYDFQTKAVNAVVDLFRGQEKRTDTFTIVNETQLSLDALGVKNSLTISDERLLANMNDVQKRHSLPLTTDLQDRNFSSEMETGTGKTLVYTKTIFELNKQYGFTKFIIVVPSVAIREGVFKSFQVTRDYLAEIYDNVPYRYFIYDSKKLAMVRMFATSSDIEVMIINIDAFKRAETVMQQAQDRLNGDAAISLVQATNPIVIIDEPQSVDGTAKAKEAIASLNPLCVFRYSATHREKINLLFRLTPVDAYQMGLVKQICVSSNQVESDFNRPYIRLVSVTQDNGFSARIEIDKLSKTGGVERKIVTVKQGANFYELSGQRELYEGYALAGIECAKGREAIEFTNGTFLALGKAIGDIDESLLKRAQIRRTIETHLEKEVRYLEKGIKVLSLFFIDEVAKYRDIDGNKGVYAEIFEECYLELINQPRFEILKNRFGERVSGIHNGYFSQDKRGAFKDTKGDTEADYDTYNTIMKDKEWLLSFDCPLRFIFSHSALKEGWDNPNVFQVCTLIEQKSTFTCRQKVGRGLRLCVNQNGERIEDRNINILHVMANESFAEFAENLQKEIENETGLKFGMLQLSLFNGLVFTETVTEEKQVTIEVAKQVAEYVKNVVENADKPDNKGENQTSVQVEQKFQSLPNVPTEVIEKSLAAAKMGAEVTAEKVAEMTYTEVKNIEKTVSYDDAAELMTHFENKGYVTKSGNIKDTMKAALATGTLDLPARFEAARTKFENVISTANTKPIVFNASKEVRVKLKKEVLMSPEFLALWEKIKAKTSYRVSLDERILKGRCLDELAKIEHIQSAQIVTKTAKLDVKLAGVSHSEEYVRATEIETETPRLCEILRMTDNECFLSQRSVAEILRDSGRVVDYINNPQKMAETLIETVKAVQNSMQIDGIKYHKLAGEEYYFQEIFDSEELIAYLDRNAVDVQNSVYSHVMYDSETVERPFAVALDNDPDVKMFFKIPSKFKIDTPIGTYNPDWAILVEKDGSEQLYFVLETKGTIRLDELRTPEQQKIKCGVAHFKALGEEVVFPKEPVRDWKAVKVGVAR
jgi:type III restriction enzyme